jgi:hypothetical protein
MQEKDSESSPVWCLVGNLREVTSHGPGGADKRFGTNSFSPGAKLYCLPLQWGDGYETIKVIGHHRRTKKYVTVVTPARHITNWRAQLVYSPEVIRRIVEHGYPWQSREEVDQFVKLLAERGAERYGDSPPSKVPWWQFWKWLKSLS